MPFIFYFLSHLSSGSSFFLSLLPPPPRMKAVLFIIACLIAAIVATPLTETQSQFLFTKFVEQYNKQYETREFFTKYQTFKNNLGLIVAHNAKESSFKMAVNKFADMTPEEFGKLMGLRTNIAQPTALAALQMPVTGVEVSPIDWRTKNVVNPVKDQGQCGSCWAFSTMSILESRSAIATGKLYDLAEQQLVDCAGSAGNYGCNGGLMTSGYEYLIKNKGACLTKDYPYTATDGKCKHCTPEVTLKSYKTIAPTQQAHQEALQTGPVAIALAASSAAFQFYTSGVLTDCTDTEIDHAVSLVGWAASGNTKYWIVRNSWGPSWGSSGYINIAFANNPCAITTCTFDAIPVV